MDITVHHAELSTLNGQPMYVMTVDVGRDDGFTDRIVHLCPAEVFESRSAEYDIDLSTDAGWDDVLHMVLYEPHLDQPAEHQLDDPDALWNAPSVAAARKARLARVKARRGAGRLTGRRGVSAERVIVGNAAGILDSGPADPLEFIKATAPVSAEHLKVKREYNRRTRSHIRARRAGRHPFELADLDAAAEQARTDTPGAEQLIPARESAQELAARIVGRATQHDPAADEEVSG